MGKGRGAGVLRLSAHRQQAISGDALVGHDAEKLAGRHTGILGEHLEMATGGKTFAQLPVADRGNRQVQVLSDLLERDVVLHPPVAERGCKAGANVALGLRLFDHGRILREVCVSGKGNNPPNAHQMRRAAHLQTPGSTHH